MKILEITEFSAGICGVWQRVKQEAELLSRKHEVHVFSSDIVKGTNQTASREEKLGKIVIKRFPHNATFLDKMLTKNVTYFDFGSEFEKLNPDLVIVHTIHPHSFKALKYSQNLGVPCFLVTHAPFAVKRNPLLYLATKSYYSLKVKPKINQFKKIIRITEWETPYLNELGAEKEKIIYIPNGIPKEFFKEKIRPFKGRTIVFLGRIAEIKDLETLIRAVNLVSIKNPDVQLKIIGQAEAYYLKRLKSLVSQLNLQDSVKFIAPIYDLKKKINALQQADLFVLPSKREAMPQSLIEAMSLGKIVISTNTMGGKEIIQNGKTGFLFNIGNEKDLASIIEFCLNKNNSKLISSIQKNTRKKAEEFNWDVLITKLEKLINKQ